MNKKSLHRYTLNYLSWKLPIFKQNAFDFSRRSGRTRLPSMLVLSSLSSCQFASLLISLFPFYSQSFSIEYILENVATTFLEYQVQNYRTKSWSCWRGFAFSPCFETICNRKCKGWQAGRLWTKVAFIAGREEVAREVSERWQWERWPKLRGGARGVGPFPLSSLPAP